VYSPDVFRRSQPGDRPTQLQRPLHFRASDIIISSHLFFASFLSPRLYGLKHSVVAILSYVTSSLTSSCELPRCGIWDNGYHYLRLSETAGENCRAELARAAQKRVYSVLIIEAGVRWKNIHSSHGGLRLSSMSTSMRSVGARQG
jgi:hypothetical protein